MRSRFVADYREGVLKQGAEFLRAKAAGLIGDEHIVAEIGQVLAGDIQGRRTSEEVTVYKSLGHIVQDLATAWALYTWSDVLRAATRGMGGFVDVSCPAGRAPRRLEVAR